MAVLVQQLQLYTEIVDSSVVEATPRRRNPIAMRANRYSCDCVCVISIPLVSHVSARIYFRI